MFTQTLSAEGYSRTFILQPNTTVTYTVESTDLNNGVVYIEAGLTGFTWGFAYDVSGVEVDYFAGLGSPLTQTAILRNETKMPVYYRLFLQESGGTLAGTVDVSFTDLPDPSTLEKVAVITDEYVEFLVPIIAPGNDVLATEAGVGITGGANTVYATGVERIGNIIRTTIVIDLTDLNGGGTAGDIIGTNGAGVAHLGQLTQEQNGDIVMGRVFCAEVPTGSNADVDLWSANEATGVEDTAITDLTGELQLTDGGAHTLARTIALLVMPLSNQYLYLTSGAATAGTFTAGKFVIELFGVAEEITEVF